MRIGKYEFRPKVLPTLATIVLLPVLVLLGFWQLSRTEEKRAILIEQEQQAAMPPYELTGSADILDDIAYRYLLVSGKYQPQYTIYIDNKVHQGKVGYQIVVPLLIKGTQTAVLINRGWIAGAQTREVLPVVQTPEYEVMVKGLAKVETKDIVSFGSQNRLGNDWPALVRWVDIARLQSTLPFEIKPFVLLQESEAADGLIRQWHFVNSPPEKNLSYAVQWFALAATLLLIFFWVNMKKVSE